MANIGAAPTPVQTYSPQVQQALAHPQFVQRGLQLPAQRQQFVQSLQQPNLRLAQAGNIASGIHQNIVQPILRTAPEIAASVTDMKDTGKTYHPGNRFEKFAFGDTPVKDIQQIVHDTQAAGTQHISLGKGRPTIPIPADVAALGVGAFHVVGDALALQGAAKNSVTKALTPVVKDGVRTALPGVVDATTSASKKAIPAAQSAAKNAADTVKPLQQFVRDNRNITAQQKPLRRQITATQAKIDSLPLGDAKAQVAAENYQRRIDSLQGRHDALEASRPKIKLPNQQGFIAGPLSPQYQAAKLAGKVFKGVDGKPRFEVDDSGAKIKNLQGKTLGDVLDHPQLYENYPDLKNTPVVMDNTLVGKKGEFDGKTLRLNPKATIDAEELRRTILHETQHNIQDIEKFASGDSPETFRAEDYGKIADEMGRVHNKIYAPKGIDKLLAPMQRPRLHKQFDGLIAESKTIDSATKNNEYADKYRRLAGEAEARAVEARASMSPAYRDAKPFYNSLDVPKKDLIVRHSKDTAMSMKPVNGADTAATKREIAELDRKINAFTEDSPAKQVLVDRRARRVAEIGQTEAPSPTIPDHLQPLAEEAKKYKSAEEFVKAHHEQRNVYWHGSPSGDMRGGAYGLHVGTRKAAQEAMESRIGIPADGSLWDGTKKYGETLLAGKKTQAKLGQDRGGTGFNAGGQNTPFPEEDFYIKDHPELRAVYSDGTPINHDATPNIAPFKLKGEMSNSPSNPMQDFRANSTMTAMKKRGTAKRGYYYKNEGEDAGSISAVVPSDAHVEKVPTAKELTDLYNQAHAQAPKKNLYDKLIDKLPNESGYAKIPGAKDFHEDLTPMQKKAVNEYANALEEMGSGQGVDFVKNADGYTRVSNNSPEYSRLYEQLGHKPTKYDWFDEAKRQLQAGKADEYMQADYNKLPSIIQEAKQPKPVTEAPVPAESRKSVGSSEASVAQPKTAPGSSTTPALPRSRGAVSKPETPASTKKRLTNVGSQAKDTPDIAKYAKTFGISKQQATHELSRINDKPVKTRPLPALKDKPASAAENTAKNPVKVSIPEVKPGNYEQARINPQIASHPINYAAGQVLDAAKGTGLDTSTFGRMVEGDLQPRNAREAAAVQAYKDLTNRVHATSQALGGNTPYVKNYFRHEWDLSNPEDAARFDKLATKSKSVDPYAFGGLDRQPRVFSSIAQGEAAGFKLKNPNLKDEVAAYGSGSAHALKQQALAKALTEADIGEANKTRTFDMGGGKNVLLSEKGMNEAKGYKLNDATNNKLVKGYRRGNRGFKQMLLSVSQFHPVNISLLRAAPTLASEFHPARAAKGVFDTFAAQAAPRYSAKLQTAAMRDGTLEASARLGTPIKFGSDYSSESKVAFGNGGLGEKAIFERAMPAMHIQMVKSAVADLKDAGLSLDSREAHALGTRINEIMGFVNTEVRNLDRGTQRRLGDIFLAPQFTRSKWATNKAAVSQGGLAGSYARRAVVSNAAAAAVVAMGVGYALHQKSDNTNDMLLRGVFHPSVPTPLKDKKGNTMELGLPATQSSEVLGLLGFSLKRKADGHLGIDWKGGNVPGNVANYGRSRLAVLPANVLKATTNTDYAGKPLYDPQASAKTKLEQGVTTIGTGLLPIGGQGIVQTNAVKQHLPDGVQQVLNANTPGSNPLVKSIGSSFGLTPKTDKTTGKGLQTTQYFDAVNQATKGLNANDKAAYDSIHPQSKNPVSGTYQTTPTIYDSQQRATTYLKNPNVLAADNKLNQQLQKDGQTVDPFYKLNSDQQNIALNYSALAQGDTRRSSFQKAYPFLQQLSADRNSFFSSLPASTATDSSGNSKAQLPANLQYPSLSADEQSLVDKYYSTTSPTTKKQLLNDPSIASAVGKVKAYSDAIASTRRVPKAEDIPGYTPPVPKNPVPSANTGTTTKTTYDPTSNTWTEVSSKTGRTTVISADGTRTVTNAGVRTSSGRRSTSTSGRKATIKSVKLGQAKLSSYKIKTVKVPKVSLSGTMHGKMQAYKQPTLKLRKKAYS